jgi:hypothetical protein
MLGLDDTTSQWQGLNREVWSEGRRTQNAS